MASNEDYTDGARAGPSVDAETPESPQTAGPSDNHEAPEPSGDPERRVNFENPEIPENSNQVSRSSENSRAPNKPGNKDNIFRSDEDRQHGQQLVILLHSHHCQQRQQLFKDKIPPCKVAHCATLKAVLNHIPYCPDSNTCQVTHCASSKYVLRHFAQCTKNKCPLCLPMRSKWQQAIPFEERQHLIDLMLKTVSTNPDTMILGQRISDKKSYAEAAEKEMYRQARSRKEYYLLLSDRMWQIEMDIEAKRRQGAQDIEAILEFLNYIDDFIEGRAGY